MATRRRASTRTSSSTRRRTTRRRTTGRGTSRTRSTATRRRKGTATSFGSAAGLLLVWVLVQGPWWLKILTVVLAVAAFAGYVVVTRRGADDAGDSTADGTGDGTAPDAPPSEGTSTP
ncbi:MAG: hypothetical protein HY830_16630 [Actinobacteria bacterium]|nr:hypothetical protein [Actinomycetota bacterium]